MAYSIDLRQKVIDACDRGRKTRPVAQLFGVSESWVRRLKQHRRERKTIDPSRLIFLDESCAKTNMTRGYGWGQGGERVVDTAPGGHYPHHHDARGEPLRRRDRRGAACGHR